MQSKEKSILNLSIHSSFVKVFPSLVNKVFHDEVMSKFLIKL